MPDLQSDPVEEKDNRKRKRIMFLLDFIQKTLEDPKVPAALKLKYAVLYADININVTKTRKGEYKPTGNPRGRPRKIKEPANVNEFVLQLEKERKNGQ